jgi:hypothetical protein
LSEETENEQLIAISAKAVANMNEFKETFRFDMVRSARSFKALEIYIVRYSKPSSPPDGMSDADKVLFEEGRLLYQHLWQASALEQELQSVIDGGGMRGELSKDNILFNE